MRSDAGLYQLKPISSEMNEEMLRLLDESPIEARGLSIVFDRRPDIFAVPRLRAERTHCAGFFRGDRLAGFAMLLVQTRLVNGEPRTVGYFGSAHVRPEDRGRGFMGRAARLLWPELGGRDALGYAVVMTGNRAAERFIGRAGGDETGLPRVKAVAEWRARSILILGRRRPNPRYRVRPAKAADVDAVVALLRAEYRDRLFAPVVEPKSFIVAPVRLPGGQWGRRYVAEREGKIVGTCAVADAGGLKQTRLLRLGRRLRWLRAIHAAAARPLGRPSLPGPGEALREAVLFDCAARGRDPRVLRALLTAAYNECVSQRFKVLVLGDHGRGPLLRASRGFFGPSTASTVVLCARDPALLEPGRIDAARPYIDMIML